MLATNEITSPQTGKIFATHEHCPPRIQNDSTVYQCTEIVMVWSDLTICVYFWQQINFLQIQLILLWIIEVFGWLKHKKTWPKIIATIELWCQSLLPPVLGKDIVSNM